MDLNKALHELYEERKRVERAIHALESGRMASSRAITAHRRGRRTMSPEERLEVSRRMTEYWRNRRARMAGPRVAEPIHAAAKEAAIA